MKRIIPLVFAVFALQPQLGVSQTSTEEEEEEGEILELEQFSIEGYGATAGGAQDIRYFRDASERGEIPHPETLTAEGLFSEHDLPLPDGRSCAELFCINGQAMPNRFVALPDADYIAQVGFTSGINAESFMRRPLNLVAVVDKSGSMHGRPLRLVRESLREVVKHLGKNDQLSIVVFSNEASLLLPPTLVTKSKRAVIRETIQGIESYGGTNLDGGMQLGFRSARKSAPAFYGNTRVMLFTDERPNIGRTDAQSFMGMARAASLDGIGLTTIGVGIQFGAELANEVNTVRGANLFFFAEPREMKDVFENEFDTLVTELAYDLDLVIRPAAGLRITGIYGIPGDMIEWTDNDAIKAHVSTIFLSRRKGAIFATLAPVKTEDLPARHRGSGGPVTSIDLAYLPVESAERVSETLELSALPKEEAGLGLRRGALLVDQYASLKKAGRFHYMDNDQENAYRTVHKIASVFRQAGDPALEKERDLLENLENTLAFLSGHMGEGDLAPGSIHEIHGVWETTPDDDAEDPTIYRFVFWPNGYLESFEIEPSGATESTATAQVELRKKTILYTNHKYRSRFRFRDDRLVLNSPLHYNERFVLHKTRESLEETQSASSSELDPITSIPKR